MMSESSPGSQTQQAAPTDGATISHCTFQISEKQFDALRQSFVKVDSPKPWYKDFERLAQLVSLLAVLVGGAWALYQFLAFGRDSQALGVRLQEIEERSQQLAVKQQEIRLKQEEVALVHAGVELELKKGEQTIQNSRNFELTHRVELRSTDGPAENEQTGFRHYRGTVFLHMRNGAPKEPLTVTYVAVRYYLGTATQAQATTQPYFGLVNGPTTRPVAGAVIDWKHVGTRSYVYRPNLPEYPTLFGASPESGGGTRRLSPSESSELEEDFVVSGRANQWIGFIINIGINGGQTDDDRPVVRRWLSLADADKLRSPAVVTDEK
jgi:hypothetical protein